MSYFAQFDSYWDAMRSRDEDEKVGRSVGVDTVSLECPKCGYPQLDRSSYEVPHGDVTGSVKCYGCAACGEIYELNDPTLRRPPDAPTAEFWTGLEK